MTMQTFGALFHDVIIGKIALEELRSAGFINAQISMLADEREVQVQPPVLLETPEQFFQEHNTTGDEFAGNLEDLGIAADVAEYFERGIERGGALVTVKAGVRAAEAYAILERRGADFGLVAPVA